MDNLLLTAPSAAIPNQNTKAYKLLMLLANGRLCAGKALDIFRGTERALLNNLKGKKHRYWRIITIKEGNRNVAYILDYRHLSGSWFLDQEARTEQAAIHTGKSKNKAIQGAIRLPVAQTDHNCALKALSENKKPTED
jgi:hypothetical protein